MVPSASTVRRSNLVDLLLALATSVGIGISVLREKRKQGDIVKPTSLSILMVLCVIGSIVRCVLVLNCVGSFLG